MTRRFRVCENILVLNFNRNYLTQQGPKSFRPDQLFKVTEIKQICYFSTQSPFISTHFPTDTLTSPQMALYIPHSIFHLARLLYVRPETFGPYYVCCTYLRFRYSVSLRQFSLCFGGTYGKTKSHLLLKIKAPCSSLTLLNTNLKHSFVLQDI